MTTTPARRSKKGLRGKPGPKTKISRDELFRQYMALRKPGVCAKLEIKLLANIKKRLPELVELFKDVEDHWKMEDGVYRYYHMSFKARGRLIPMTQAMRSAFKSLLPGRPLCPLFETIYDEGLNPLPYPNKRSRNTDRDVIEAFFHAWYFLRMLIKYGKSLKSPPDVLPSGWAAVLELYQMR